MTYTLIVVEKYAASAVSTTRTLRNTGGPAATVAPVNALVESMPDDVNVPETTAAPGPATPRLPTLPVLLVLLVFAVEGPAMALALAPAAVAAPLRLDCERCLDIIRREGRLTIFASTA